MFFFVKGKKRVRIQALAVLRSEAERTGATLEVVDFCAQDGPSTVAENAALAQRASRRPRPVS